MAFNPDKPSKLGTELSHDERRYVLAAFVHRYTATHIPAWAKGTAYEPQFASDDDWLAHTRFQVTKAGKLSHAARECYSTPTWPTRA